MKYLLFLFIMFFSFSLNIYGQNEIYNIKNGALLVRLQTNAHLIDYYSNKKMVKHANREQDKQNKLNEGIINTFKKEWSLCPVYFFYSTFSNEIQNNDFNNVFKDLNQPLSNQEKNKLKNNFLIAYIGDTPGSLKFNALVLNNKNFKTLPRPFPRYVRTYKGLWFFKRKLNKSIQILEKKINFQLSRI